MQLVRINDQNGFSSRTRNSQINQSEEESSDCVNRAIEPEKLVLPLC